MNVLHSQRDRILNTKDYSLFNYSKYKLQGNKVTLLMEDIQKKNLNRDMPVMIDSEYNILDGRHVFIALENLKLPVHYKVCEVAEQLDFLIARKYDKKATPFDFCVHHLNKINYRKVMTFVNETPFTFISTFKYILKITDNMRNPGYKLFQEGKFELNSHSISQMADIKKWLAHLEPLGYSFNDVGVLDSLQSITVTIFDKILNDSKVYLDFYYREDTGEKLLVLEEELIDGLIAVNMHDDAASYGIIYEFIIEPLRQNDEYDKIFKLLEDYSSDYNKNIDIPYHRGMLQSTKDLRNSALYYEKLKREHEFLSN